MGLLMGFEPSRLPAALLDLAAYKLTFVASLALLAAGAIITRHARRNEPDKTDVAVDSSIQPPGLLSANERDAWERAQRVEKPERV